MLGALCILEIYVACLVCRYITVTCLEDKVKGWNPWVRLVLQYYTIVFVGFIVLVCDSTYSTLQAIFSYGFANPENFLTHAENVAKFNEEHSPPCPRNSNIMNVTPLDWTDAQLTEVRFDTHGVMRFLVLGSCPAVVLTQLIGWVHISKHLRRIKNSSTGKLEDNKMRDKAIQIMLLPVIYSVIAYKNVIRLMNLFTGAIDLCASEWDLGFHEKKAYTLSLYEANFAMADFYEAVALLRFTTLTVTHIKETWLRSHATPSQPMGLETPEAEANAKHAFVLKINTVLQDLVESGVASFCLICLVACLRGLYLVFQIAWYKVAPDPDSEGILPAYISGAGMLASTVAIANVVKVERAFHDELHAFKPSAKFWSTKVIVSIAFIQEKALGVLGWDFMEDRKLSELQIKLLYSSLLCFEVLLVAMLHVMAWPADVNITAEERGVLKEDREYWDETPDHGKPNNVITDTTLLAREPLLAT